MRRRLGERDEGASQVVTATRAELEHREVTKKGFLGLRALVRCRSTMTKAVSLAAFSIVASEERTQVGRGGVAAAAHRLEDPACDRHLLGTQALREPAFI